MPKGSKLDEARGFVQTPLQTEEVEEDSTELTATIRLPPSLCPATMAFRFFVADPDRPFYIRPLHGNSVCVPLGMARGEPKKLGAHIVSVPPDVVLDPKLPVRVNFAVVARHARALFLYGSLAKYCGCMIR
jgi:hypothetical protein